MDFVARGSRGFMGAAIREAMSFQTLAAAFALIALQTAPQASASTGPISSIEELPIEQSAAPRCAVAFAIVGGWQSSGDARGSAYPDMASEGGREFFVRAMAGLMEAQGLTREAATAIIMREVRRLSTEQGATQIEAMMPACLLMKRSTGL